MANTFAYHCLKCGHTYWAHELKFNKNGFRGKWFWRCGCVRTNYNNESKIKVYKEG